MLSFLLFIPFLPPILAVFSIAVFVFEAFRHRKYSKKINSEIKSLKDLKEKARQNFDRLPTDIINYNNKKIKLNTPNQNPQKIQNNLGKVGAAIGIGAAAAGGTYFANKKIKERGHDKSFKQSQIPDKNIFNNKAKLKKGQLKSKNPFWSIFKK